MLLTNMDLSAALKARLVDYDLEHLGETVRQRGVVQLHGFLPPVLKAHLQQEADKLLDAHGRRVNVLVKSTGNTPRKYISVSRNDVFEHAPSIGELYFDPALIGFLAKLTKTNVIESPYEPEQIVVNKMDEAGDTHGWHWDDYSYSLVLVLAAPDRQSGAQVEYIDGTSWDKNAAPVQHYLDTMPVQSLDLTAGSAYLLLGKRVMHRVAPMLRADSRKIICFSYATEQERFAAVDHGSMTDIYG
jgi:hypothetical protein